MKRSKCEDAMIEVLRRANRALTLGEIVPLIQAIDSSLLSGATPTKSLYSMLVRREQNRSDSGLEKIFSVKKERNSLIYSLESKK